jgi:hypothetical protein
MLAGQHIAVRSFALPAFLAPLGLNLASGCRGLEHDSGMRSLWRVTVRNRTWEHLSLDTEVGPAGRSRVSSAKGNVTARAPFDFRISQPILRNQQCYLAFISGDSFVTQRVHRRNFFRRDTT